MDIRGSARFWNSVDLSDITGCWLWTGTRNHKGYGYFSTGGTRYRVHRLAWQLKRGAIPAGQLVCHTCDVRNCINPDHLFLGTARENNSDRDAKGRRRVGNALNGRGLTTESVREMRKRHADGARQVDLARQFNCSVKTVSSVVHRRSWVAA